MDRKSPLSTFTFTVADSASLSDVQYLRGYAPKRILVPSGVEGTHLAFLVGEDPAAMLPARKASDNSLIALPITAGASMELDLGLFDGMNYFQIKTCSASNGTAQTQTGAASISVVVV